MRLFLGFLMVIAVFVAVRADAAPTRDSVAIIIGNKHYRGTDLPDVKYADRDAMAMQRYVIDVLGYNPASVFVLNNATQGEMVSWFGNERGLGQLANFIHRNFTDDIFVYYSGHGVAGLADKQNYLLPTDSEPSTAELNGYSLKLLYANLDKTTAKSITVVLDACFSGTSGDGTSLFGNSSALTRGDDPKPEKKEARMTVITAASASQLANWDDDDRQGLFTEYFLRAVYGQADLAQNGGKGDGRITLGAVRSYLDNEMSFYARRHYRGRTQDATVTGDDATTLAVFQPGKPPVRPNLDPVVAVVPGPKPAPAPAAPPAPPPVAPPAAAVLTPVPPPPPAAAVPQVAKADDVARTANVLRQQGKFAEALALFRQAAAADSVPGMVGVGDAYWIGQGVPRDYGQALEWYKKAARLGNAYAMNHIGFAIDEGLGISPADPVEAFKWYRAAADRGDADGLTNVGFAYITGRGTDKNISEGLKYYYKGAEAGSVTAMYNLGDCYDTGLGVARDPSMAVNWFRKAADRGNASAMNRLGEAYDNGRGVAKDVPTAIGWYRKAADLGNAVAMNHVGQAYENSYGGLAQDWPQSVVWYRKGADGGFAGAMSNLGYALEYGRGVTRDDAEAARWYRKAADLGNIAAMYELGQMYRNGRGLRVDVAMATQLLRRAADLGSDDAKKALGEMQTAMAPAPTTRSIAPPPPAAKQVDELQDFGVAPQAWLQANVGSPTPTSIPAPARVVTTPELIRALNSASPTPFLLIDVLDGAPHATIRGAVRMPVAGHGGSFSDANQQAVVAQLAQVTGGKRDTPLVFFCLGPICWESYNAALRARQAGYQRVYWYRGGLEAWMAAGQPTG
jgi:PQQ-dependent catabolism-associated CXXCW motif protein